MPSASATRPIRRRPCPRRAERRTASARRPRRSTASAAARRSESRVCCTTPGIDAIGPRLVDASATNIGRHQMPWLQGGLGDQTPHRRRGAQPARTCRNTSRAVRATAVPRRSASGEDSLTATSLRRPSGRRRQRRRVRFLRGGGSAPSARSRAACSASASTSGPTAAALRLHVHAQAEFALRSRRSSGRCTRRSCARAACRRCRPGCAPSSCEVKHTASNPPVLIISRVVRGRRRGTHRAVGGDVLDLPAAFAQALGQRLGGDVGPRQQHPVHRVENVVVGRELVEQAQRGLLARRHQFGADAERAHPVGGGLRRRRRSSRRRTRGRPDRTRRTSPTPRAPRWSR